MVPSKEHDISGKGMVPSFPLLSQTYHNSRYKLAGKGNSGGGKGFKP